MNFFVKGRTSRYYLNERFLLKLAEEFTLETILYLAEHVRDEENRDWDLLLVEIVQLLTRGYHPQQLFEAPRRQNKPKKKESSPPPANKAEQLSGEVFSNFLPFFSNFFLIFSQFSPNFSLIFSQFFPNFFPIFPNFSPIFP